MSSTKKIINQNLKTEFTDFQSLPENQKVCESCGFKLEERKCKLLCKRCGYFRSCSDLF